MGWWWTGIGVHGRVTWLLMLVAVLVAVATALVGPVTFLGLLVANLAYQVTRTHRHVITLTASILVAAVALVLGQALLLLGLMVAYALLLRPMGFLLSTTGFLFFSATVFLCPMQSELQPTFTGAFRQRFHPTVIKVTTTVKDHFADRLLLQLLSDHLAHLVSGILVSRTHLQRFLDLQGVRRHQGVPSLIVYC